MPDGGALLVVVHPHLDPTVLQAAAEVAVGSNRQLVADGKGFGNVDAALLQGSADGIGAQPGQQLFRPLHPRVAEADQYDAIISQGAFGEKFLQSVHILPGLVVEPGRAFLRAEVDRQPYGAPGQLLIGLGQVRLRADGDGTDVLADKADLAHHGLPGVALGEVDQRSGQGVGFVWTDIHEQPAREGIVFGGDQFRCGQHGLRVSRSDRERPGRCDTGQADEADGADIPPDREGQLAGGGVALCAGRQLELARAEYHVAEGFPGAGVAIAGMDMDWAGQAAQLAPVGDLAGEHLGYLIQVQGLDGVVRMDYYRDAVQTYDLFRIGAEHVPGGGEVAGFGLADGAGGGTYLRRSVLQSLERGAGAVGVDAYFNAATVEAGSGNAVFPGGLVEV